MLCFRDMTFCSAECQNKKCERNWGLRDKSDYDKWSESFTGGGPVAFCDFSSGCEEYKSYEPQNR